MLKNEEVQEKFKNEISAKISDFLVQPSKEKLDFIIKQLGQIVLNFDLSSKDKIKSDKLMKRGGFEKRIILEKVDEGDEVKIYNKLVRDNIVDFLVGKGFKCESHIADEQEFKQALVKKVSEELAEFFINPCEEEVVDVEEVLGAILVLK